MVKEIDILKKELQAISKKIYKIQAQIDASSNTNLVKEKKPLQYQVLFYLEKIHNLEKQKRREE